MATLPHSTIMTEEADRAFLAIAVQSAVTNVELGGGPFASLIVKGDQIIGKGVNRVVKDLDPTAHSEITAIRAACRQLMAFQIPGTVLFSSCEPCPMCLAAALWAHVDRVVYGATRVDAARNGFDDLRFYNLFEMPRQLWSTPVVQVVTPNLMDPFRAWQDKIDKIPF
ncbi:nucleoside deaminase [Catellatospora sp. KI3]|uniref:nucleoside deaminase n=1 Tax=Catellatospora sp. KI3 TaxID=3041620 RepID=UPI00248301D8|nr:nucleoside deaminase [Catellatospora sp. KI3]MDI1464459.1 nucleoside deaminase [Catellatospora sp. KI3]